MGQVTSWAEYDQAQADIRQIEAMLHALDAKLERQCVESCAYSFMQDTVFPEPGQEVTM